MRCKLATILVATASVLPAACGGISAPTGAHPAIATQGEAKAGDLARCPVSGEQFVVSSTTPKIEHEGKTYFFCCPDCMAKFLAAPQSYLHRTAG